MDIPTFVSGKRERPKYEERIGEDGEVELVVTPEWADRREDVIKTSRYREARVFDQEREYVGPDTPGNMRKVHTYVDSFQDRYRSISLYLWSRRNSTQKSTVARWIGRRLIDAGLSVQLLTMGELAAALPRRGFEDEDTWLLDRIKTVDFLIIDDAFDPKKVTIYKSGYQIPFLDSFLRQRLESDRKAICFTSNIPPDQIDNAFGVSIRSLVIRSVPDPFEMNDGIDDFDVDHLWD